jgi:hypothetical protein
MTPVILAAALAVLAADSAPAASDSTTVKPATVGAAKTVGGVEDPDRVICKNEELTGSRFTKRVCMTKAQWDDKQRQVEIFERRINQTATPTGGGGYNGG